MAIYASSLCVGAPNSINARHSLTMYLWRLMISAMCFLIWSCSIFCWDVLEGFRLCSFLERCSRSFLSRFSLSVTISDQSLLEVAGAARVDDEPISSASVDAEWRAPRPNNPLRGRSGRGVPGAVLGGEPRGVLLGVREGVVAALPSPLWFRSSALYSLSNVPRIPP